MRALLSDQDPPAFCVEHESGASDFVFICDHAGRTLPRALGDLGVSASELERHIAWDIGIAEVGKRLADQLDAFFITQTYSRLVIDCNRHPGSAQSIVPVSERTAIPGNVGLTPEQARQRAHEIFEPYHARIRDELAARDAQRRTTMLVTLHSFTPSYLDQARAWHMGVLYYRDARMAHALLDLTRTETDLVVGDNEPYSASAETDYALLVHGEHRGLPCVELEVRQDLITDAAGQAEWAQRLATWLPRVRLSML